MTDAEGDDPEGVVDPQLPIMPTQPGDGGGNEPNEDDWRSITCTNEGVTDHTMYGPDRWKMVDADGAWASAIDGWQYNLTQGRIEKHFANNVSDPPYSGYLMLICPTRCLTTSTVPWMFTARSLVTQTHVNSWRSTARTSTIQLAPSFFVQ